MPTLLRHHCPLDLSSHRTTCGIIADLWLTATFPLLWDLATSLYEAVRDQNLSLFLGHHRRLVAASSPTFICAHRRLRHHCRLYHAASWKAVRDHYKVFLAASCRLSFALTGACDIIVVCIMLLLGKQRETITRSFLRHHADFHLRSQALATS
jgi:hypothetical protein